MLETDDIRETIVAIDGLMNSIVISAANKERLQALRKELVGELKSILDEQSDVAKAS